MRLVTCLLVACAWAAGGCEARPMHQDEAPLVAPDLPVTSTAPPAPTAAKPTAAALAACFEFERAGRIDLATACYVRERPSHPKTAPLALAIASRSKTAGTLIDVMNDNTRFRHVRISLDAGPGYPMVLANLRGLGFSRVKVQLDDSASAPAAPITMAEVGCALDPDSVVAAVVVARRYLPSLTRVQLSCAPGEPTSADVHRRIVFTSTPSVAPSRPPTWFSALRLGMRKSELHAKIRNPS